MSEKNISVRWPDNVKQFDPSSLPTDADNYDVFCERCQRVHSHFTMTREKYKRLLKEQAKQLADEIDRRMIEEIYK